MHGRILIVDDEPDLVAALEYAFGREGFKVRGAVDGHSALEAAVEPPHPELILLDLMLPDMPGTEVFRRLRAQPELAHVPVVMLTARGDEIDRVVGFELGADDYVVKPFSTRELILRVRAVLRRSQGSGEAAAEGGRLSFGALTIDPDAHRVRVGGAEVELTALEFRLLQVLCARGGRVQSRAQLIDEVWGIGVHVEERSVDTQVKRLRRKLKEAGDYIETIRGVGYRFRSDRETP